MQNAVRDYGRETQRMKTMDASGALDNQRVVITGYGDPSVLKVIRESLPLPKSGEVRIKVEAAGVSFGDVLQRSGLFFAGAPKFPYTPGYDVVGTIDAVGDHVNDFRVGDRVAALTLFAGYARYVCVPTEYLVGEVPRNLDATKAVALVLNYTTAFQMIKRVADVRKGQSILIYGASGGVGTALLDLAKLMNLRVAAAVSKRWHDTFKGQADLLFDERDMDARALRKFQPAGFDAAFDPIGGAHAWRTRSLVARQGKLVLFGIAGAVKPGGKRDLANVAGLSLLLAFSKLWRKPAVVLHAIDQLVKTQRREINDDIRTVVGLLAQGAINPRIGAVLPLAEAQRAHQLMESRENVGKIVLVP